MEVCGLEAGLPSLRGHGLDGRRDGGCFGRHAQGGDGGGEELGGTHLGHVDSDAAVGAVSTGSNSGTLCSATFQDRTEVWLLLCGAHAAQDGAWGSGDNIAFNQMQRDEDLLGI